MMLTSFADTEHVTKTGRTRNEDVTLTQPNPTQPNPREEGLAVAAEGPDGIVQPDLDRAQALQKFILEYRRFSPDA